MVNKLKKLLCYTLILALLQTSFQPIYAVKISPEKDADISSVASFRKMRAPYLEDSQTTAPSPLQPEEPDVVSRFFFNPLKTLLGETYQGTRYVVRHPLKAVVFGLFLQARAGNAMLQLSQPNCSSPTVSFFFNGDAIVGCSGINDGYVQIISSMTEDFLTNSIPIGAPFGQAYNLYSIPLANGDVLEGFIGSGGNIYGIEFNRTGGASSDVLQFPGIHFSPVFGSSSEGELAAAWFDAGNKVYCNNFNSSWDPLLSQSLLLNSITNGTNPSLALSNDTRLITFQGSQGSGPSGIYSVLLNRTMYPYSSTETLLNNATFPGYNPSSIALSKGGRYFTGWQANGSPYYTIRGRLSDVYNKSLVHVTNDILLSGIGIGSRSYPSFTKFDEYIFGAWQLRYPNGTYAVYGGLFNGTTLDPVTSELLIRPQGRFPRVASHYDKLIVTWWDDPNSYAQFITPSFLGVNVTIPSSSSMFTPTPTPTPMLTPTPAPMLTSTNPSMITTSTSVGPRTSVLPSTSQVASTISISSSLITSANPTSGIGSGPSNSSTGVSTPLNTPSPTPFVQSSSEIGSSSSTGALPDSPSWKESAAIAGGVGGGALLLGALGVAAAKECRSSEKNKPTASDIELDKDNNEASKGEEYAEENGDADNGESRPPANVDDDNPLTLTNIARNRPSDGQYVDLGNLPKKGKHKEQTPVVDDNETKRRSYEYIDLSSLRE